MAHLPAFDLPDRTRAPAPGSKPAPAGNNNHNNNNKKNQVVKEWKTYIGDETLEENRVRFLHDLGLGDFKSKSKTQCKKAIELQGKWVNIYDFLYLVKKRNDEADCIDDDEKRAIHLNTPVEVYFHSSQKALSKYTRKTKKFYPCKSISNGSPLKLLLARIR